MQEYSKWPTARRTSSTYRKGKNPEILSSQAGGTRYKYHTNRPARRRTTFLFFWRHESGDFPPGGCGGENKPGNRVGEKGLIRLKRSAPQQARVESATSPSQSQRCRTRYNMLRTQPLRMGQKVSLLTLHPHTSNSTHILQHHGKPFIFDRCPLTGIAHELRPLTEQLAVPHSA